MGSIHIKDEDVEVAANAIKLGKVGGTDDITGEFIKYGGKHIGRHLK